MINAVEQPAAATPARGWFLSSRRQWALLLLTAYFLAATFAVLGPNFKYCASEYFDCADHTLALSHVAVGEHLYAAGFEIQRLIPRFLPYSFRSMLPASPALVRADLKSPFMWPFLGKQFLALARRA